MIYLYLVLAFWAGITVGHLLSLYVIHRVLRNGERDALFLSLYGNDNEQD